MSEPRLYLKVAEEIRRNPAQWEAYESHGHCVVLAGPGSGKTKTLTLKLARMLAEDVHEPRGIACITYSNECARELEQRLDTLGVTRRRVFIGTVHSFALTQVILPYARVAAIDVPDNFRIATQPEQRAALQVAFDRVINRADNPQTWRLPMDRYRRSHLDRDARPWLETDPEMVALIEAYEAELRRRNRIDFDDMPLLAVRAFREHEWIQEAIKAKFPILFVDEYQDLGQALHRMVMGLCFTTGIRLFAVGDVDQSIYGFTGASPDLLRRLAERADVHTVRLRFNYRSGARIVTASQYALGEDRDYEVPEGTEEGTIYFRPSADRYEDQADALFGTIIPEALERVNGLRPGEIAVLYPAAWIGDIVATAARARGYEVIRADGNAIYPRHSTLMRWLEMCGAWCCGGWRSAKPSFRSISFAGAKLFGEALPETEMRLAFERKLIAQLWARRTPQAAMRDWVGSIRTDIVDPYLRGCRSLSDEVAILTSFEAKIAETGDLADMTLEHFAGQGAGNDRITLTTLHSSKGREFSVVVLFAIDNGRIPRRNAAGPELSESRRSFYVGFTRAKHELHIMHSLANPSPFVREVQNRLQEAG